MKQINLFFYSSVSIYALLICLNPKLASILLGVVIVSTLLKITSNPNTYRQIVFQKKIVLLTPILFFILTSISFLFTTDDYLTFKSLGKKVWFVFLPLFFFWLHPKVLVKIKKYSLNALTLGAFLSSFYLLVNLVIMHYNLNKAWVFDKSILDYFHTGFHFTAPLDIHPTYLGLFISLSLAYIIIEKPLKNLCLLIIFKLVILITILFLASRIIYALAMLLFLVSIVQILTKSYKNNHKNGIFLIVISLILILSTLGILSKTYIGYRMTKETYWDLTSEDFNQKNLINKQDSRLSRWKVAIDLIKDKPFFGYGAGTEKYHLVSEYNKRNMKLAADKQYGAHSQFISYFLEFGIFGFLIFIHFLIINIFYALKSKSFLGAFFFISLFFSSLFENIFNNNSGIVFIAFFSVVFTYTTFNKNISG